jgi:predicted permease
MQDLRDALRALRATPAISVIAMLSLALGVGANTAIFSIVDSLLLRSLPVRQPQRLVLLDDGSWTNPIWEEIRDRHSPLFEGTVAWSTQQFDLAGGGEAQLVDGLWASGRFFDVLGVNAVLGRTFSADDDRRGGGPDGPVTVISHRFWQQRFGGAADAIGRSLTINRVAYTIIGVTPPDFFGPEVGRSFDVIVPIGTEPLVRGEGSGLDARSMWWLHIVARLKPGQTIEDATAALRGVQPQIREATLPQGWRTSDLDQYLAEPLTFVPATTGPSFLRDRYRQPLLAIMAVVALVLLIACANIANLMLARANGRRHELSVRLALGASRIRLARQFLAESLLLSVGGAALGLAFAHWGSQLLVGQLSTTRSTVFLDLALDWRVLGFTTAVAIATAVLFGTAPALRASRVEPNEAIKEQGRAAGGGARAGLASPLVVVQVALSLVLVVAAGLFVRTFSALANRDLGFDRESLLVVSVDAEASKVGESGRAALFQRVADAVASVPGVEKSAASAITPVSGMTWNNIFEFPDKPALTERERIVNMNVVTPGWFATYGIALVAGRDFETRDRTGAVDVAIVNQAFVKKYFDRPIARSRDADGSAIGRVLRQPARPGEPAPALQIVGVVKDSVYRSVREPAPPIVYRPIMQIDGSRPSHQEYRRGHRQCGSGSLVEIPATCRPDQRVAGTGANRGDALGVLRSAGAAPRGDWPVRRHLLCGQPPADRDRHPDGPRRRRPRHRRPRAAAGRVARRRGDHRRGRDQPVGIAIRRIARVRPGTPRSGDLRRGGGSARRDWGHCRLAARPPGNAHRPGAGVERRMTLRIR